MFSFLRNEGAGRKKPRQYWLLGGLLFGLCLAAASCSSPPKEEPKGDHVVSSVKPPDGVSPDENLYEQLRSGTFQLNAAAGSVEDTLNAAKESLAKLKGNREAKAAMEDVIDFVDSAGEGIVESGDEPPTKEEVAKNFSAFDDKRLKAIESANDSLHDLREALGLLESLANQPDSRVAKIAIQVKALLAVAIDDLWGAIEALGGEPEPSDEPLNP